MRYIRLLRFRWCEWRGHPIGSRAVISMQEPDLVRADGSIQPGVLYEQRQRFCLLHP